MKRWVLRLEDREADRSILGKMEAESEEAAHERANRLYGWMYRVKRVMPDDRREREPASMDDGRLRGIGE